MAADMKGEGFTGGRHGPAPRVIHRVMLRIKYAPKGQPGERLSVKSRKAGNPGRDVQ